MISFDLKVLSSLLVQKNENKKASMAILELPGVEDEPASGNHIVETDSIQ
jgi:hypothetical protein